MIQFVTFSIVGLLLDTDIYIRMCLQNVDTFTDGQTAHQFAVCKKNTFCTLINPNNVYSI